MDFKKDYFSAMPSLVTMEGEFVRVCFDAEEGKEQRQSTEGETEEVTFYKAYVVRVQHPVTRSKVIDAIVTAAYPSDVMQAIVNNHLLENDSEEHEAEYNEMQAWRVKAKSVAADVMAAL